MNICIGTTNSEEGAEPYRKLIGHYRRRITSTRDYLPLPKLTPKASRYTSTPEKQHHVRNVKYTSTKSTTWLNSHSQHTPFPQVELPETLMACNFLLWRDLWALSAIIKYNCDLSHVTSNILQKHGHKKKKNYFPEKNRENYPSIRCLFPNVWP